MVYLRYRTEDGIVIQIHTEEPVLEEGQAVMTSEVYKPGDEFEYLIRVVDEHTIISIKQAPAVVDILKRIGDHEKRIAALEQS